MGTWNQTGKSRFPYSICMVFPSSPTKKRKGWRTLLNGMGFCWREGRQNSLPHLGVGMFCKLHPSAGGRQIQHFNPLFLKLKRPNGFLQFFSHQTSQEFCSLNECCSFTELLKKNWCLQCTALMQSLSNEGCAPIAINLHSPSYIMPCPYFHSTSVWKCQI